jgi:hypothetical protein
MKKLLFLKALTTVGLIIVLSGCKTTPIYNIIDHPINYEHSKALTLKQISQAIFKAGLKHGWTMVEKTPNKITATHIKQQFRATVDIIFDQTHYSIDYDYSKNLGYDGTNINRRYNSWVVRLSDEIRRNLGNEFNKLPNK